MEAIFTWLYLSNVGVTIPWEQISDVYEKMPEFENPETVSHALEFSLQIGPSLQLKLQIKSTTIGSWKIPATMNQEKLETTMKECNELQAKYSSSLETLDTYIEKPYLA